MFLRVRVASINDGADEQYNFTPGKRIQPYQQKQTWRVGHASYLRSKADDSVDAPLSKRWARWCVVGEAWSGVLLERCKEFWSVVRSFSARRWPMNGFVLYSGRKVG